LQKVDNEKKTYYYGLKPRTWTIFSEFSSAS